MAKKTSFDKANEELQNILHELQNEETSIDKLSTKLKRAKELVSICREKLHNIEVEIDNINDENS
ncbi:MAG: exodeoxyribonuclease VII small subunit [Saprospiraceae bacterium]|nr:exodeoxyribonuclease VII small subunit [Saprospiraceae bacterium]